MATRSLNVVISGDAKQLGVASKQAGRHIDDVESRGKKMGKTLALGFASAGAAAAGALVVGLKKSVDAAIEAEKSQAKLKAQLNASGISYRAHAAEIDKVIQKHSRLAGVDDEDLQDAFTGLVRSTGSVTTAMKDMGLVTDIMRGKNVNAAAAGKILEKAHMGNVGALKKLGIAITPVTTEQDKLRASNDKATAAQKRAAKAADDSATATKAIGELQRRFSGQAEKYGKTAAGAQDRFRVAVENLQEKIGDKLLPVVTKATNKVSKFVSGMDDGTGSGGSFAKSLNHLTDALEPYTKATGDAVAWTKRHDKAWTVLNENLPNPMRSLRHLTTILNAIKTAADAVVTAVKAVGSAFGWAGNAAKDAAGFFGIGGDGIGKLGGGMGSTLPSGTFGGGLMGARPSMAPFASAASRFGLHVSSGKTGREHKLTSSGNVSYHSTGEAIDVAGTPSGMLGFFRQMKSTAGGKLAELIYTPGGAGVKNGHPYTYTGKVAADHFDHVHVAYDTGVPGVGDGEGRVFGWAKGHGFTDAQSAAWVGNIAQESGFDSSIKQPNGPGRGLAQWGGSRFTALVTFAGKRKKPWTDFNTQLDFMWSELQGSERGAYSAIKGAGSLEAAVSAIATQYERAGIIGDRMGPARSALARFAKGGSGGSGSSKGKPTGTTQGGKLPAITPAFYDAPEGPSDDAIAAQGFLDRKAGKGARPIKGGGPTKGITQDEADARANLAEGPTQLDFLDSAIARATLTPGTDDDIAALTARRDLLKTQMDSALGNADPRDDAAAITAWQDATAALGSIVADNTEAMKAHTAAVADLAAQEKRVADIAGQVRGTSEFQLTKYLADLLSGHIVGRGVMGRSFTPGTGVEVAY